jgi:NADPH:quinone reductase-like Zn-dependent oxidoreductase
MWADRIRKATLCADAGQVTAVNLSHARITPSITPFEISRAANDQYDVIFDLMGNYPLKAIRRVLRSKGTFVGCGGGGPDKPASELLSMMVGRLVTSPFTSQKLTGVFAKINPTDLNVLGDLLQFGKIEPVLDRSYPLCDVAEAPRYVESCHARGKVTIVVA